MKPISAIFFLSLVFSQGHAFGARFYSASCSIQNPGVAANIQAEVTAGSVEFALLGGNVVFNFYDSNNQYLSAIPQLIPGGHLSPGSSSTIVFQGTIPSDASNCSIDLSRVIATSNVAYGIQYYTQCFQRGTSSHITMMIPSKIGLSSNAGGVLATYFLDITGRIIGLYDLTPLVGVRLNPALWSMVESSNLELLGVASCVVLPQNAVTVDTINVDFSCRVRNYTAYLSIISRSNIPFWVSGSTRFTYLDKKGPFTSANASINIRVNAFQSPEVRLGYDSNKRAIDCRIDKNALLGLIKAD